MRSIKNIESSCSKSEISVFIHFIDRYWLLFGIIIKTIQKSCILFLFCVLFAPVHEVNKHIFFPKGTSENSNSRFKFSCVGVNEYIFFPKGAPENSNSRFEFSVVGV